MVRDKDSGLVRAAKLVQKGSYGDEVQLMMRELHVLSRLEHENVLTFYAAFESPTSLILVTEIGAGFHHTPFPAARPRSWFAYMYTRTECRVNPTRPPPPPDRERPWQPPTHLTLSTGASFAHSRIKNGVYRHTPASPALCAAAGYTTTDH